MSSAERAVPVVDAAELTTVEFNRLYRRSKRPMRLLNATRKWPEPEWSLKYLLGLVGHRFAEVSQNAEGIFDYNPGAASGVVKKKTVPFPDALELILSAAGRQYYIQQQDIIARFPELLKVAPVPEFVDRWKVLEACNLWVGGQGCRTPLHIDGADNFLVQALGRKRLVLFPPDQSDNLYPAAGELLSNCSRVNVFLPDREAFPLYSKAEPHAMEVVVEPGDAVFIPRLWWHAVESLDVSISINYWWRAVA